MVCYIDFERMTKLNFIAMNQPKILQTTKHHMITHMEASANYTILNMKDGRKLISAYSLKVFEGLLSGTAFVRISRAYLVNRSFIASTLERDNGYYFQLKNKEEILIPRRRRTEVLDQYNEPSNTLKTEKKPSKQMPLIPIEK
ncbi:MAG: DNA-binding LytR/AlgR family response regulator [Arcticibacterium sp.]